MYKLLISKTIINDNQRPSNPTCFFVPRHPDLAAIVIHGSAIRTDESSSLCRRRNRRPKWRRSPLLKAGWSAYMLHPAQPPTRRCRHHGSPQGISHAVKRQPLAHAARGVWLPCSAE